MNSFNAASKLKEYSVTINGIDLVKESINEIEIAYSNDTPEILADLVIDDLIDLSLQQDWNSANVEITYMDIFDEVVKHEFKILDVQEEENDNTAKTITLQLQDKFSYVFENSYVTKGFTGNVIDAMNWYVSELGLSDYSTDFTICDDIINFVVPKHMNNMDFFIFELAKYGYLWYQDKTGVKIKSYDELLPSVLPLNSPALDYTNESDNQLYANLIQEILPTHSRKVASPSKSRAVMFDVGTKAIIELEHNTIDDLIINSNTTNIQDGTGLNDVYYQHGNTNNHKLLIKRAFMQHSMLIMVVNGYKRNDINQVYNLKLKGNLGSVDSQNRGNRILGGKWVSRSLVDKIIGDTMIQKITLSRADSVLKD